MLQEKRPFFLSGAAPRPPQVSSFQTHPDRSYAYDRSGWARARARRRFTLWCHPELPDRRVTRSKDSTHTKREKKQKVRIVLNLSSRRPRKIIRIVINSIIFRARLDGDRPGLVQHESPLRADLIQLIYVCRREQAIITHTQSALDAMHHGGVASAQQYALRIGVRNMHTSIARNLPPKFQDGRAAMKNWKPVVYTRTAAGQWTVGCPNTFHGIFIVRAECLVEGSVGVNDRDFGVFCQLGKLISQRGRNVKPLFADCICEICAQAFDVRVL